MGGQWAAVLPRAGCKRGVSSTREAGRPTAIVTRALIRKPFGSGGIWSRESNEVEIYGRDETVSLEI